MFDLGNSHGKEYYWSRSTYVKPCKNQDTDYYKTFINLFYNVFDPLLKFMDESTKNISVNIETVQMGGKISEISSDSCSFAHREAKFEIHCIFARKGYNQIAQKEIFRQMKLANSFYADKMTEFASSWEFCLLGGGYINTDNLMAVNDNNDLADRVFGSNAQKLKVVKNKYDPTNFFNNYRCISPENESNIIEYNSVPVNEFICSTAGCSTI